MGKTFEKMDWEILERMDYNPDLALPTFPFHLFGKLKEHLLRKHFVTDQEIGHKTDSATWTQISIQKISWNQTIYILKQTLDSIGRLYEEIS